MGLSMYDGAVYRALQFKTNTTIWTAIGRTTVWADEGTAPQVDQTDNDIEEVIAYSKPYVISLCKPVIADEDVTVDGQMYAFVADLDAIDVDGIVQDQDARFLYMVTEFDPNEGTAYGNFRQVAVYADLVPASLPLDTTWLNPAGVEDPGALCYLHNDVVTTMSPVKRQVIELVLEFK
jgi:hypothetical protein